MYFVQIFFQQIFTKFLLTTDVQKSAGEEGLSFMVNAGQGAQKVVKSQQRCPYSSHCNLYLKKNFFKGT